MKNVYEKSRNSRFLNLDTTNHPVFLNISIIEYNEPIDDHYMLGSGKIYLYLGYGDIQKRDCENRNIIPEKIGVRPTEKFYKFSTLTKAKEIRVGLKPQKWFHLTKVKAKEWGKEDFNLGQIVGSAKAKLIYEQLRETEDPDHVLKILDAQLQPYYKKWSQRTPLENIIAYIYRKKGQVSIKEILLEFPISRSSLHNYFDTYIGFPPKFYIRLVRFNHVILKYFNSNITIAEIIRDEDYYDYSHFKRDFEQFTGYIPAQVGGLNNTSFRKFMHDSHIWLPVT